MDTRNVAQGALAVGIDIGTTTVSAVVYDLNKKMTVEAHSTPHDSYVLAGERVEQSVSVIVATAEGMLNRILETYGDVVSIGVTGQMHGIVYVNGEGEPVSNLITWQDKRADRACDGKASACEEIFAKTGERIATGYGLATHYYNAKHGEVPAGATGFVSIMDLFAMGICGAKKIPTHASVAASFGLFDAEKGVFKGDKLALLGIDETFLPQVTGASVSVGTHRGIPVAVAIGDNQASFLGSVGDNRADVLVNVGTGSQVSVVGDYRQVAGDTEVRPFIEGKHLICGSALCGGFAYAMVERFFRRYIAEAGLGDAPQYETMNRLAREAYARGETGLNVETTFLGRRSDPSRRGSITEIGSESFTPAALILGVLNGMSAELHGLYTSFHEPRQKMIASGGGIKKNDLLRQLMADRFGMEVLLPETGEEAATGAALFSALAVGKIQYKNGFSDYIRYV